MAKTHSLTLGGATLSLEQLGTDMERRMRYRVAITLPDGTVHAADDLRSGCGNDAGARAMMGTLLSFLGACAESYDYRTRHGMPLDKVDRDDNLHLFPLPVAEWASQNDDAISLEREAIEGGE